MNQIHVVSMRNGTIVVTNALSDTVAALTAILKVIARIPFAQKSVSHGANVLKDMLVIDVTDNAF